MFERLLPDRTFEVELRLKNSFLRSECIQKGEKPWPDLSRVVFHGDL